MGSSESHGELIPSNNPLRLLVASKAVHPMPPEKIQDECRDTDWVHQEKEGPKGLRHSVLRAIALQAHVGHKILCAVHLCTIED